MKQLVGALVGLTVGVLIIYSFAVVSGGSTPPWFVLTIPAGLILGWRAGAAWRRPDAR